ncbi:hypothetical protein QZQ21_09580 [Serratia marcescens]|nr:MULTISPECIES: hypothetical protein [Serratia]MBH2719209.1 hypothetical protein [Serratia ureilytica]MDP8753769.1 hypothetical protein [Serratia marcescens]MDP8758430.1 hypothetical protein [Serratia marcescens]MDP8768171.1 hypothetical protein [Serratia marcescens]MDP8878275.1 hypothetical protein [Serratia marcescens]
MDEFSDEPDDSHLFPAPRPRFIQVGEYMVVDICMRMLEPRELIMQMASRVATS